MQLRPSIVAACGLAGVAAITALVLTDTERRAPVMSGPRLAQVVAPESDRLPAAPPARPPPSPLRRSTSVECLERLIIPQASLPLGWSAPAGNDFNPHTSDDHRSILGTLAFVEVLTGSASLAHLADDIQAIHFASYEVRGAPGHSVGVFGCAFAGRPAAEKAAAELRRNIAASPLRDRVELLASGATLVVFTHTGNEDPGVLSRFRESLTESR